MRNSVVLPTPLGPTRPTRSPACSSKPTFSNSGPSSKPRDKREQLSNSIVRRSGRFRVVAKTRASEVQTRCTRERWESVLNVAHALATLSFYRAAAPAAARRKRRTIAGSTAPGSAFWNSGRASSLRPSNQSGVGVEEKQVGVARPAVEGVWQGLQRGRRSRRGAGRRGRAAGSGRWASRVAAAMPAWTASTASWYLPWAKSVSARRNCGVGLVRRQDGGLAEAVGGPAVFEVGEGGRGPGR